MKQQEQELIAQVLGGDEEGYAQLIDRYKVGLYHHCFIIVHDEDIAEDLAHEAFIEAYLHLESYNPEYRFSTWLYKIATNICLAHKRRHHDIRMDEDELDRVFSTLPPTEQFALYRELHDAVDGLTPRYRSVVTMHYWQGKSYSEIACHMGTSVGSIKGWMSRAKQQLKEILS